MGRRGGTMALVFVLVAGLAGCGKHHPVEGTLVWKDTGEPAKELVGYLVSLKSVDEPVGGIGDVQADGTFSIKTGADNGAILGKHKVAIAPFVPPGIQPKPKLLIPSRYGHYDDSGLEIEVKAGTNKVTLTVEKR